MDQYIGKILGNRYEIVERIGSGGMAVVYKAKCHLLNRYVAVKILKDDLAGDEEFRRRFHEESQAVAMLSHPNIVSIYDVSQSEDPSEPDYIVMELIEGITLKQLMQKQGGRLNWKEALHFITQIMRGLAHAHSRGIIHRDIKPHNIMILRDGSVRVADFGIARLASATQNTMTQEALGSVHYISPEQARGSHIDCRSDIYSAGVVLYEMLTGRLPYEGDSPVAVAIQHINSIPLSPRELDPSIPQDLEEITMKAMASDVDKRYASANAMLTDLEEFRKNPNITFDYPPEVIPGGENDEPTQPLGTAAQQAVPVRPVHIERYESVNSAKAKGRERRGRAETVDDIDDDYDEGGGFARTMVIISAVILCLVCVGAFLWQTVFKSMVIPDERYSVPNVAGYTIEEAKALPEVTQGGFEIKEGRYVPSEDVEADHIIRQEPEAGEQVKSGNRTITVEVSSGSEALKMPDVLEQDWRVAKSTLENMGLVVRVEQNFSEDIPKDNVMFQSPAKEATVEKGQEVTIEVSQGRKLQEVPVPQVLGMTQDKARETLESVGLKVGGSKPVADDHYPAGQICKQDPMPYTIQKEGSVVSLEVSTGPEILPPPGTSTSPGTENSPAPTAPTVLSSGKKEITVELPSDRETVEIRITVGGVEVVPAQAWDTRLRFARFTAEGTGVQEVVIYMDGVAVNTYNEDFSQ